jgi:hypothetical protein
MLWVKKRKGMKQPSTTGDKHPRWNPNKKAFRAYANRVRWKTVANYNKYIHIINPNGLPRGRCGVEGAYQIDHVVSIKECFDRGISVEEAAAVSNLAMLPWARNRAKGS